MRDDRPLLRGILARWKFGWNNAVIKISAGAKPSTDPMKSYDGNGKGLGPSIVARAIIVVSRDVVSRSC